MMGRAVLLVLLFVIAVTRVEAGVGRRSGTPMVRYIEPESEAVVDLSDKEELVFRWKRMPRPAGGRGAYRLEVFKGFGYEHVINETLDEGADTVRAPREIFEDGEMYTWQVRQRDRRTGIWGRGNRWSFTVKK